MSMCPQLERETTSDPQHEAPPSINMWTFSSRSQMRGQGRDPSRQAFHETAMFSEQGEYISVRDESNMEREADK